MNPKAKTNILVEELPDEILVYDLDRHRAHCLNPTAAFLLREADGTRDAADLARLAEEEFGEAASEELVSLGLERLKRARLVEWEGPGPASAIDRRKAIRRMAAVGIALPAVMTIVSPTPAQAATQIPIGACNATTVGRCCSNGKLCRQQGSNFNCNGSKC